MRVKTDAFASRRRFRRKDVLTLPLRRLLGDTGPRPPWDDSAPIRAELFSVERLEEHARSLAAAQAVTAGEQKGASLVKRLAENEAVLVATYRNIAEAVDAGAAITPAAEWLVDNFHVVEKQIREIRADLPPGYYRQLPKLAAGPFARYPRVFGVAWAFVAHTDSLFDPEVLHRYLRAYQEVQPLTIGELWAIAITLRIVLVENLRRIAKRVIESRAGRRVADVVADRLLAAGGRVAEPAAAVLPLDTQATFSDSFLVQLVHRLRDQDPGVAPALAWLDGQLARQGTTADVVVRDEHQRQVAASITVRNIITSMRLISDVDWRELFERVSLVDDVFMAGSRFQEMDFPTRNLYRSAVEEIARGSQLTELEVAHAAVAAAAGAHSVNSEEPDNRLTDLGYYLIAGGRPGFDAEIGFKPPARAWPGRFYRALGIGGYVSAGVVVAAGLLAIPLASGIWTDVSQKWLLLLGLLGLIPAADLAVVLVNLMVTRGFRATLLPALDLRGSVPQNLRTLVAVPTLLTSLKDIEEHIKRLEIHYLASPHGDLHFALLSDWADATSEHADGDDELLAAAKECIAGLNRRYGPAPGGDRFLLLHRRRVWNQGEGHWIGWERKRGKLCELNRLLRGAENTSFLAPPAVPADIRYVITLDADTRLPRETVGRLIGKMAHPLNRPRFDAGRRTRGRGIRGAAATRHALAADGPRRLAVPAHLLEHERHRSLCLCRLRRVPGSVWRRLLCRQGYLRRGCVRGRAERARAGEHPSQPRSFRGNFRPRRPGVRHRGRRRVSLPLRRRRGVASTAGRGATGNCCHGFSVAGDAAIRSRCERASADRPLEDARQSAPHALRAVRPASPDHRMGHAVGRRGCLDRLHPVDDCSAAFHPGNHEDCAGALGGDASQPLPRFTRGVRSGACGVGEAGENDFLDFPEEGHGHGQGHENEEQGQPDSGGLGGVHPAAQPAGKDGEASQEEINGEAGQEAQEEGDVEGGEQFGFLPQVFIRQHGGESLQHAIDLDEQEQAGEEEQPHAGGVQRNGREFVPPIQKRGQAGIEHGENLRPAQGALPNPFLGLKRAQLVQAVPKERA